MFSVSVWIWHGKPSSSFLASRQKWQWLWLNVCGFPATITITITAHGICGCWTFLLLVFCDLTKKSTFFLSFFLPWFEEAVWYSGWEQGQTKLPRVTGALLSGDVTIEQNWLFCREAGTNPEEIRENSLLVGWIIDRAPFFFLPRN